MGIMEKHCLISKLRDELVGGILINDENVSKKVDTDLMKTSYKSSSEFLLDCLLAAVETNT